jgi:hypothetical protein
LNSSSTATNCGIRPSSRTAAAFAPEPSYGPGRISITDPLSGVQTIEGAVSQGVILASSPNPVVPGFDLNIFIAIPMGSLNNESFTSVYQTAVLDFSGEIRNAFLN